MTKLFKRTILPFALCMIFVLLSACGATLSLPDGMSEDTTEAMAKEIVSAANNADYAAMVELFSGLEGTPPPTEDEWEEILAPVFEELDTGAFVEYGEVAFTTVEDDTIGPQGVVLLECDYENISVVWQVVFSQDMKIIGLFL